MADQTSTARIKVQIEGAEQITSLTRAFQTMRGAAPRLQAVSAGQGIAQTISAAVGLGNDMRQQLGAPVIGAVTGPLSVIRDAARTGFSSLIGFLGPIASIGVGAVAATATLGGAAIAIAAIAVPLALFAATLKLMRSSFGWASDSADETLQNIARTRRTFPAAIGAAFTAAEGQVRSKFALGSAIFGHEAVNALDERITRLFTDVRLPRGLAGDQDIFTRWGITPDALQMYQQLRGQRLGATDYLLLFARERERLNAIIQASPEGSSIREQAIRRRAQLFGDSAKIFGSRFSDILTTWSQEDIRRLGEELEKAAPLGAPSDPDTADQDARDFKRSFAELQFTFGQLKQGIAGDTQPAITNLLEGVRSWLTSMDNNGQTIGGQLRNLLGSLAIHAWRALENLLARIDTQAITDLTDRMKGWSPEDSLKSIPTVLRGIAAVVRAFATLAGWVTSILKWGGPQQQGAAAGTAAREWVKARTGFDLGVVGGTLSRYTPSAVSNVLNWTPGGGAGGGGPAGGGGGGATGFANTGEAIPQGVLSGAASEALKGGQPAVDAFMRRNGYPRNGAWCGQFAAAVVKSKGIQPPPNPGVAGNWVNWGKAVVGAPQAGDVAVVRGVSPRTGSEGKHVAFVESYNEKTGMVTLVGGNQGPAGSRSSYPINKLHLRQGAQGAPDAVSSGGGPTAAVSSGKPPPADLANGINWAAGELGIKPQDLATVISFETAGSFDPNKLGPTTRWGRHKGLIQWGEPQARQYLGNDFSVQSQMKGIVKYMRDNGVKPGMPLVNVYAAVNAGGAQKIYASDTKAGGTWGTVLDKVRYQMGAHQAKATALLRDVSPSSTAVAAERGPPDKPPPPLTVVAAVPPPSTGAAAARTQAQELTRPPPEAQRAALTAKPPPEDRSAQAGTAAGEAAATAFKNEVAEVKIPIKLPTTEEIERKAA